MAGQANCNNVERLQRSKLNASTQTTSKPFGLSFFNRNYITLQPRVILEE